MQKIDLITFDCYGTLIDWEDGISSVIDQVAGEIGMRVPARKLASRYVEIEFALQQSGDFKSYREILAMGLRLLFAERGAALDKRRCLKLAASLPRWKPFPETKKVLLALKRAGCRLGVLSNTDDALLAKSLARIGVPFDIRVTSQQVRSYKPRMRHWERALELAGVPKARVLHVAASQIHDMIPAKALGLRCIWINRSKSRRAAILPDHTFTDLTPLPDLLKRLESRRA
ncbi:MAG: haloacid dehalogenase type II [Elusimicrobiota bacterium]